MPTDPRYVAACGQVKPAIPRVVHRLVDRIVDDWLPGRVVTVR